MSQQDEERREFEVAFADIYGDDVELDCPAAIRAWKLWQAARRAPEHEKAAPMAEPVAWLPERALKDVAYGNWGSCTVYRTKKSDGDRPLYDSHPPASDEQRAEFERLKGDAIELAEKALEYTYNTTETLRAAETLRKLAALCEEVMGQP